jgi:hypothetical protein
MNGKQKVQAMPGKRAAGIAKDVQINPGKAGPKGALGELPPRKRKPASRKLGKEGQNTHRGWVNGPRKSRSNAG